MSDLERRDADDRANGNVVRILLNARPGYHHLLYFRGFVGRRYCLRKRGRCRCSCARHCDSGADCILQFAIIPHLLLPDFNAVIGRTHKSESLIAARGSASDSDAGN
jgi:hypothetical protein